MATTQTTAAKTNRKTARANKRAAAAANPAPAAQPAAVVTPAPAPAPAQPGAAIMAPVAAAPAPKTPRVKRGVAPTARTRAYYAGRAIAVAGHGAPLTPAMAGAVGAAFGTPNVVESEICLRNAWHAIRGYAEVCGITLPVGPAANGSVAVPVAPVANG